MGYRGVVPNMFGGKYSSVNRNDLKDLNDMAVCFFARLGISFLTDAVLYFSNKYGILFFASRPCPPRVILSEAAHRVWGRTQQPNNAAQRTPPQAGRQQAGSPLFERTV